MLPAASNGVTAATHGPYQFTEFLFMSRPPDRRRPINQNAPLFRKLATLRRQSDHRLAGR